MQLMKIYMNWDSEKGVILYFFKDFAWKKFRSQRRREVQERLNEKKDQLEKILERNKSKIRCETFDSLPHKRSKGKAPEGSST